MRRAVRHPARLVPLAFLAAIAVGTGLMMLPVSRAGEGGAPFLTALFTATSAVCVTGLTTVETPTYWTGFGQAMITLLTQIGGFGIMTAATLLAIVVTNRLGITSRLLAQAEGRSLGLANVRQVLIRVGATMLICEAAIAVVVTARWWLAYDHPFGTAVWEGVFHAVSSFNNAGFSLYPDSLAGFVGDWWICVPITTGIIAGSVGFPVLFELARLARRPSSWSIHTRLTVFGSAALLVVGFVVMLTFEWSNPETFGPLGVPAKILAAFTQGSMPRSGGFSSVDIGGLNMETKAVVIALMFLGGGSASTAGGIKVTTFLLLAYVIWTEIKGEEDVVIGHRRIAEGVQRQAVAVALLGVAIVATGTLGLIATSDGLAYEAVLFEVMSAFATVGLSTGITPDLPGGAQVVLVIMMFVGRVGPVVVASALALRARPRLYRYPEERPIVG
jgi:potassium uptake TrkH family protein